METEDMQVDYPDVNDFLSYLWGMETGYFKKAKGVLRAPLFILPMRNGNYYGYKCFWERPSFYPTYEEWKLHGDMTDPEIQKPFYPTYEEWKLSGDGLYYDASISFLSYLWGMETFYTKIFIHFLNSFYPTYEEWKRR